MPGLTDRRALRAMAVALPVAAGATLFTVSAGAAPVPASPVPRTPSGVELTPRTTTLPPKVLDAPAGARDRALAAAPSALPTFTGAFTQAGTTYRYTMVGSDPKAAGRTTTVHSTLTPVSLKIAGHVIAPSAAGLTAVRTSGLFTNAKFPGGTGQYGDVYMRTQFWSLMNAGRKPWHVRMAAPTVKPALKLTVPTTKGGAVKTKTGVTVYLVDVEWFDSQVQSLVGAATPDVLTQIVGGDVVLCGTYVKNSYGSCGIGGYHSATLATSGERTYSYQSLLPSSVFGKSSGFFGLAPMSHELAEWLTDPYLGNTVPHWTEPSVPQYGCSHLLEVGDPLVGHALHVGASVYQDVAYLPYFTKHKSTSWLGRYSWFGTLKHYSKGC